MPFIRQTNFLGGELDPFFWGRTDLPIFGSGARRLRNFFASKQGAAVSRPGTQFVGYQEVQGPGRLVPFVYSDGQAYVLLVVPTVSAGLPVLSVRFFFRGGILETTPGSGLPYEVLIGDLPTGYFDVALLKWAQVGDVLTLTHPFFRTPRQLLRLPNTLAGAPHWTTKVIDFAVAAPYFGGSAGGYPVLQSALPAADATHPAREWIWYVTLTVKEIATGKFFETLPYRVVQTWSGSVIDLPVTLLNNFVPCYPDRPVELLRGLHLETVAQTPDDSYTEVAWNIYRGRGDVIGFVGQSKAGSFIDVGDSPDYSHQPPRGTNPFTIIDTSGVVQAPEVPRSVAYFQDKLCFGGTDKRPGTFFTSSTGEYTNFDEHFLPVAGEALTYELAARRREEMVHLLSTTQLLAGTRSSWWSIAGVQGSPLDFDSVDARMVDEVGTTDLPPLVVDGSVLFCRTKGQGVRALLQDQVTWRGRDVSVQSQHLFVGTMLRRITDGHGSRDIISTKRLIDWTYAEDPWGLVWAARDDGTLLSLTFNAQGVQAWARHDTQGRVLGVCSVPEVDEDGVYLLVERNIAGEAGTICVERMASRVRRGTAEDDAAVDCAKRYQGAPATVITGLEHLAGNEVWAVSTGNPPYGPLIVASDGSVTLPELPATNSTEFNFSSGDYDQVLVLFVGLQFTPEFESLDLATTDARMRQKTVLRVGWEVDESRGLKVGQDLQHLDEWQQRNVLDGYSAPSPATAFVDAPVSGTWDKSARGCVQQSLPLPVTLLAFVREVDIGG